MDTTLNVTSVIEPKEQRALVQFRLRGLEFALTPIEAHHLAERIHLVAAGASADEFIVNFFTNKDKFNLPLGSAIGILKEFREFRGKRAYEGLLPDATPTQSQTSPGIAPGQSDKRKDS